MKLLILNIVGNNFPHEDTSIIGNTEALKRLGYAVEATLYHGERVVIPLFDSDGEEYHLTIQRCDDMSEKNAPYIWTDEGGGDA